MSHPSFCYCLSLLTLQINQALEDTLQNKIIRYQYSHESAHYDMYSLYWNTLFLKVCTIMTSIFHI